MRAILLPLVLLCLLTGCGAGQQAWNGRRGYDGNGDYGYDVNAPREAAQFEARASRSYPAPGTPDDPWGPYVREAASRFGFPEAWIRAVMRQESGGRQTDAFGAPITSVAGAMGLMQVMPGTYTMLRSRYALGPDPFEPHSNILAGTAYLKEMYGRFGAPGFLAAYNAGPDRVSAYLAGATMLPTETVDYVAVIGPRIGMAGSFGPAGLAPGNFGTPAYAGAAQPYDPRNAAYDPRNAAYDPQNAAYDPQNAAYDPQNAAYAGGGMSGADYAAMRR